MMYKNPLLFPTCDVDFVVEHRVRKKLFNFAISKIANNTAETYIAKCVVFQLLYLDN